VVQKGRVLRRKPISLETLEEKKERATAGEKEVFARPADQKNPDGKKEGERISKRRGP